MNTFKNMFSGNAFYGALSAILFLSGVFLCRSCAGVPEVKVKVNTDGTFDPPVVNIAPGQSVKWTDLTTTDAIVQIADPGAADPCDVTNRALAHPYTENDLNEFTGPSRQGASGIFTLGPDGPGFVQKPSSESCFCEDPRLPPTRQCMIGIPTPPKDRLETVVSILDGNTYKLCPGESEQHQTLDTTWANPDITGVIIRLNWSNIQPTDGNSYDWNDLEREMNAAVRNGKLFTLDIRAGNAATPDWIFTDHNPPGPVEPITAFKDWASGEPTDNCGFSDLKIASPTNTHYRDLYVAMIRAVAAHVESDSRWFQALANVKISGANFITSEARLPKRCYDGEDVNGDGWPEGDGILDTINGDNCVCNPKIWADAGYTPEGLYEYYRVVGNAAYTAFYKRKSLGYQLIQEGFPRTESPTNFEGDSLQYPPDPADPAPTPHYLLDPPGNKADDIGGTVQTETILWQEREGRFTDPFGNLRDLVEGKLFTPQHSGLQTLPADANAAKVCSQHMDVDPVTFEAGFPIPTGTPGDRDVDGCPNRWAVDQGTLYSQIMGFQTNNAKGVASPRDVESALWNMTINSNGVFLEIYEQRLWEIDHLRRAGPGADKLDEPYRLALPQDNPARYSKNLSTWVAELHKRRRGLIDANNPHLSDPFPATYKFRFAKPLANPETYFYIDPSKCSQTANAARVGQITVSP